jgi:hypothetical protein
MITTTQEDAMAASMPTQATPEANEDTMANDLIQAVKALSDAGLDESTIINLVSHTLGIGDLY